MFLKFLIVMELWKKFEFEITKADMVDTRFLPEQVLFITNALGELILCNIFCGG